MKKISILLFLVVLGLGAFAQIKDPVSFKYEAVKKAGNTYELIITATVPAPWHIYSQNTGKNGPVPTAISFKKNPLLTLDGKPK
jgi:thiol:disulfide interchange protein DsbD